MKTVFKEVCAYCTTFLSFYHVFLPLLASMLKSTLIYFLNKFQICAIKKNSRASRYSVKFKKSSKEHFSSLKNVAVEFSSIKVPDGDKYNGSDSAECAMPLCKPWSPERERAAAVKQLAVRTQRWSHAYSPQVHTSGAPLDSNGCWP